MVSIKFHVINAITVTCISHALLILTAVKWKNKKKKKEKKKEKKTCLFQCSDVCRISRTRIQKDSSSLDKHLCVKTYCQEPLRIAQAGKALIMSLMLIFIFIGDDMLKKFNHLLFCVPKSVVYFRFLSSSSVFFLSINFFISISKTSSYSTSFCSCLFFKGSFDSLLSALLS